MIQLLNRKVTTVFAFVVACILGVSAFAQNRPISGTVVDGSGVPVIGASVVVVGNASIGAVTDIDGKFVLTVPAGANITVSCIGYSSQTVAIGNQTEFHFVLEEDAEFLEETVVIGYGVQRKSDITGAIASVNENDLKNRSTADAANALQGKAAGVQILNYSAAPGSASTIRVRGYSSNSGSALGPLLIVDGLQVDNIQYLDPSNIESMEVLKDAASAAIYGAQAGNGVVLITTKSGNKDKGKGQVFYNVQYTASSLQKPAEVMNAAQYIDYKKAQGLLTDATLQNVGYDGTDTNWSRAIFGTGLTKRHTVGVQGSNDRANYYVAINYNDENGIVKGDKDIYKRLSGQFNADYKINDWLTVGNNISIEKYSTNAVSQHSQYGTVMMSTITNDPLFPVVYENEAAIPTDLKNHIAQGFNVLADENGHYYATSAIQTLDAGGNPLLQRDRNNNTNTGINLRGVLFANITPIKNLVITSRFGFRANQGYSTSYSDPFYLDSSANSTTYSISANANNGWFYQWENFANYTLPIKKHTFNLMAGMSFINQMSYGVNGSSSGEDILSGYEPNFRYLSYLLSDAPKSVSSSPSEMASLSYFGRLDWGYDNRYNLQVNFRADAFDSSKLSQQARWGFFPSVSGGWTISNEPFFKDNVSRSAVSFLKLRASWGVNGNVAVLNGYPYAATIRYNSTYYQYNGDNNAPAYGSRPSGLANPDLKWETSHQVDVGLDARFLNDKLSLGVDWYRKETKDLLVNINPPAELGISSTTINAGSVLNTGLEFELSWKDQIGDFVYSVTGNFSTLHNEVTYLDPSISRINSGNTPNSVELTTVFEQGHPVWYFRGYKYEGVNKETGDPIIRDVSPDSDKPDGSLGDADMMDLGSGIPKYTYGITINAAWKGFDLTVFGTGVGGNKIYPVTYRPDRPLANSLEYFHKNAWTSANPNASMPSAASTASNGKFWSSSAMLFDGSFFKIKQIQLGYTLPKSLLSKIFIKNVRIFVSLDDYFTFTKYPGFDPETASAGSASSVGFDFGSYPTSKKLMGGINFTF